MKNYDESTKIFSATGEILVSETSLRAAPQGGSDTLYHLLIALSNVKEPELLCFRTTANISSSIPFLKRGHKVTIQYKGVEDEYLTFYSATKMVGKALELLSLDLDWTSQPSFSARQNFAEEAKLISAPSTSS